CPGSRATSSSSHLSGFSFGGSGVFEGVPGDRVWLDEGADHVGSARRAYADGRIYAWLLARRLRG
ncbi:MAG: hypothetical protein KY453_05120, partial [Gemmatimonadetes bacterium]|nr:hypothetical protein [Gemmatimonadota bacterium]